VTVRYAPGQTKTTALRAVVKGSRGGKRCPGLFTKKVYVETPPNHKFPRRSRRLLITVAYIFKPMTFVAFIIGFWTCAIAIGTLWLLRERERARVFKTLREDNERLRATDRERRQFIFYVHGRLHQLNVDLGEKVPLQATADLLEQHLRHHMDSELVRHIEIWTAN
jgi:hypothetical protein